MGRRSLLSQRTELNHWPVDPGIVAALGLQSEDQDLSWGGSISLAALNKGLILMHLFHLKNGDCGACPTMAPVTIIHLGLQTRTGLCGVPHPPWRARPLVSLTSLQTSGLFFLCPPLLLSHGSSSRRQHRKEQFGCVPIKLCLQKQSANGSGQWVAQCADFCSRYVNVFSVYGV